uniref:Uncharacterized protein n=1 Tax=Glossina palpalis gambiensis TaxID=67801 RepID=A0A1B0C355_9MUSC
MTKRLRGNVISSSFLIEAVMLDGPKFDGCMLPKRITGLCNRQQKRIGSLVTMAQKAGLVGASWNSSSVLLLWLGVISLLKRKRSNLNNSIVPIQ